MYYALLYAEDADEYSILSIILQQAGLIAKPIKTLAELTSDGDGAIPVQMVLAAVSSVDVFEQFFSSQSTLAQHRPLVIITDPISEKIQCRYLEKNADIIAQRPFSSRLLLAQIRVLLRRANTIPAAHLPPLKFPELIVDPATRTVKIHEKSARRLTQLEFRLLYTLMIYRGQVVTIEKIVETVWGYDDQGDRELVRGLVSRLRGKIEKNPQKPSIIITVPGIGYLFEVPDKK